MNDSTERFTHYSALNALIDRGWLRVLSCIEISVWLVYARHADRDGVAFPNTMTVMEIIGHKSRTHVWNARASLQSKGLLERLPDFEGKTRYRISVPGQTSVPYSGAPPIPVRTVLGGASAPDSGTCAPPNPVQVTSHEHTKEQHIGAGNGKAQTGGRGNDSPDNTPKPFDRFWKAYPSHDRKTGRDKCLSLWTKRKLDAQAEAILAALAAWKVSEAWTKNGGEFICGPHRWLNESWWENPPKPKAQHKGGDDVGGLGASDWKRKELTPADLELIQRPLEPHEPGHPEFKGYGKPAEVNS